MITDAEPSTVVTSAPNCDRETFLTRKIHRGPHVGYIGTADNHIGPTIDHSIVYFASDVVFAAGGSNYASGEGGC